MKICFVTTGDIKNIATLKRALGMANPLSKLNWDVHIILENTEENVSRAAVECNSDVKLHYFDKSNLINELRSKNSIVQRIKPDFIYVCAFVPRNFVLKNSGAKILIEHSELQSGISDIKGLKKVFSYCLEFYSLVYSDALICASKFLVDYFRKISVFKLRNIPIFYHPYAFSYLLSKDVKLNDIKTDILALSNKFNFTFLGTITKNYGSNLMLEASKLLVDRGLEFRLLLLGKGRHYNEAIEFVKNNKLENFVFLPGFVKEEDISQYFSISDSFLSPMNDTIQDWARCPSKLYMYLPYRKSIVTCKIGEPYIVLKDKGVYYDAGSSVSLANTMENVLTSKINKTIDPDLHSWDYRTKEFDQWIKLTFN
ncbi:glycosyltransferase [Algoriphagus pacificus]|uniref:Glycosyltransferase n=1 Tax=Algoriphagus pacificus TaxID=2811234 RepID=A0ABS3CGY4_9BACT|nr:glycosyltransferase [Algoriphagus pacificus]MBN7816353.1 glycosyltransferase [Algoriphagus pacificus]